MLPSVRARKTALYENTWVVDFVVEDQTVDSYYNSLRGEFEYGVSGNLAPLVVIGGVAFFAQARN